MAIAKNYPELILNIDAPEITDEQIAAVSMERIEIKIGEYADWDPAVGARIDHCVKTGDPFFGAVYKDDTLQPGCLICGETIPEKQAKYRAKVCSDPCRNAYRRWRGLPPAERVANPLRCQVCRGEITHRPNINWVEVCSTTCRNAMRRYRFQILQNQKCPHCYHPSSEKEREEFRQWRASKGPMQEFFREAQGRGNFAWQREKQLRTALREAVSALRAEREGFCQEQGVESIEGLKWRAAIDAISQEGLYPRTERIERFEELLAPRKKKVDTREVEESTLPASGSTAQEEETYGTQS